nr:MAG TPA: hypothetical protein [Caudoviricetes sp.]
MRNYHSIKYDLAVALCDRLSMKTVWLVKSINQNNKNPNLAIL